MIAGDGPAPALVLSLVQRLPDTSLTIALASGGKAHFGWGVDRHLMADLYDALNQNTRATGNWAKGKTPTFPAWPRPQAKARSGKDDPAKPKKTVADIFRMFNRR